MDLPGLTAVLTYRLTGPRDDFVSAADRLARRVRAEGDVGVLTYRFYLDAASATARAVVDYRDPESWAGHHAIIASWAELADLRRSASLIEVDFLGDVTEDVLGWMAVAVPGASVRHGAALVGGFVRA